MLGLPEAFAAVNLQRKRHLAGVVAKPRRKPFSTRRLPAKVNGNGSPAIQPGYRKGEKPLSYGKRYRANVLTGQEVAALLAATPKTGATGVRSRALIVVLWRTGIRINEALTLLPADVNFDRGQLTVLFGKGNKRRVVGIDELAMSYLRRWLGKRREFGIAEEVPIFCTTQQNGRGPVAITQAYARTSLKRLGRKAGVTARVHPHAFRHSLASEMADEGVDIRIIQRQLGHTSIATTQRYIDHLSPTAVTQAVQSRPVPAALGGPERREPKLDPERLVAELGASDPQMAAKLAALLAQMREVGS